jgi:hypothetical protein
MEQIISWSRHFQPFVEITTVGKPGIKTFPQLIGLSQESDDLFLLDPF